jgi:hypothetical protein
MKIHEKCGTEKSLSKSAIKKIIKFLLGIRP